MSKKHVFRIGDWIILNDPRSISRIGYGISIETMIPLVEQDEEVKAFIKAQQLIGTSAKRVIKTVAVSRVRSQMRGGAERKIFYNEVQENYRGIATQITDKRIHQIGTYYPFSVGGYDYYGECDYEPAGLDNRKTVICLCLNLGSFNISSTYECVDWDGFWVTSNQVSCKSD